MTFVGWLQIAVVLALVLATAIPLSSFIASIYAGRDNFLTPVLRPVERGFYRLAGVDETREQSWFGYAMALIAFSIAGFVSLYALQRLQNVLPLNPQGFDAVGSDLAFNTSISFITNTNWQNYGGETTMSHLTQMLGLTTHNFVSAATGLAIAFAFVRAFARSSATTVGNFWVDVTRVSLYVLLPISIIIALAYVALGVPQTLQGSVDVTTLEGVKQTLSMGPMASQEAIKQLGTNGGGFMNVNSAHPYESPNAWTNMIQIWSLLLIPVASVIAFGRAVGDIRQGRAILITMSILLILGVGVIYWAESAGTLGVTALGVDPSAGNLEGKDLRFGQAMDALFTAATTGTGTGAVITMHDSLTPLGGLVPMFNILAGCIWPGGVGAGLYGFLVVAVIAVFVAGLMVGRTPEYLGKKIETREMKLAMFAVLIYPLIVLGFTGVSVLLKTALDSLNNTGPHGLSEILYAYASTTANNGSAFAGLNGATPWFNTTLGLAMLFGRFAYAIPVLALAGGLAAKKRAPASAGTFPTTGPLFVGLLIGVIIILYLLQYFPALALGPVVEHFLMLGGKASMNPTHSRSEPSMSTNARAQGLFDPAIISAAAIDALRKLDPRKLAKNPVIFVTEVVSLVVTVFFVRDIFAHNGQALFSGQIAFWLWFTVLFANFAEAVAEGRGKAQAETLRKTRTDTRAKRYVDPKNLSDVIQPVNALDLHVGDVVLVEAGDIIPGDGEIIEGVASVNESAITGESAPVIREAGGDRSAVTGGTTVLSDHIKVRITAAQGSTFIDRMIALVEGAERQKTPNELALSILLSGLTLIFLIVCVTLWPIAHYSGTILSVTVLIALLVCLIPTTIGGLLSAIGIAGMDRLIRFNVIATSGRAVEAAGDVDTLLLDKTGTITFGNRMADEFIPVPGVTERALAEAVLLASLADETPEGRSIVALAKSRYGVASTSIPPDASVVEFTAQTRVSGIDMPGRSLRKGAVDAILAQAADGGANGALRGNGGEAVLARKVATIGDMAPPEFRQVVDRISRAGGTPLAVSDNNQLLGVIHLKDIVKPDIRPRFAELRAMGIKTVMVTGDNPLTAAAIASEAGVDDFLAQATPEDKLAYIRREQQGGRLIAMCGDGTNDAPALAQADVGVAMQTGTQAAREAGNMVDLDSDPTKLIEIVGIGKQLLMTRGSLTTFSIANDVAKYFAIIPALFVTTYPELGALNIMGLHSDKSAILAAVIFNALIIIALIPLALRGVAYRPVGAAALLSRNLLIYGLGGIIAPFIGIKIIDVLISALHLA